ncbi:hypothetical protein ADUPG1_005962 [Aduncisulcus paluster]|uniref:RRM domain-containing protein n=1 Tax=Aduncisulcus paluster TaxID=2918883 RepID=A0ABQ5KG96_9EUKA|nr:hypothetical protein ADUPG1_005962 [Aduncisulcus paluster]
MVIFLHGLPDVCEKEVFAHCQSFGGTIIRISKKEGSAFCFVEYSDEFQEAKAIRYIDRSSLKGKIIRAEPAKHPLYKIQHRKKSHHTSKPVLLESKTHSDLSNPQFQSYLSSHSMQFVFKRILELPIEGQMEILQNLGDHLKVNRYLRAEYSSPPPLIPSYSVSRSYQPSTPSIPSISQAPPAIRHPCFPPQPIQYGSSSSHPSLSRESQFSSLSSQFSHSSLQMTLEFP